MECSTACPTPHLTLSLGKWWKVTLGFLVRVLLSMMQMFPGMGSENYKGTNTSNKFLVKLLVIRLPSINGLLRTLSCILVLHSLLINAVNGSTYMHVTFKAACIAITSNT